MYGLVTFEDTHSAMLAARALREQMSVLMMPTPRGISASCGMALRFELDRLEQVRMLLPTCCEAELFTIYQMHVDGSFLQLV